MILIGLSTSGVLKQLNIFGFLAVKIRLYDTPTSFRNQLDITMAVSSALRLRPLREGFTVCVLFGSCNRQHLIEVLTRHTRVR